MGSTWPEAALKQHVAHPCLSYEVCKQVEHCDICQCLKCGSKQYGELVPHDAHTAPWNMVAVGCIGPWVIKL